MKKTVGIVGAGVIGRGLALELHRHGFTVTLFDRDTEEGHKGCTWTGAGMLAPYCELETADPEIAQLGLLSFDFWPDFFSRLPLPVYFQRAGSLVVAHPQDMGEVDRFRDHLLTKATAKPMREVRTEQIGELEPDLAGRFNYGLYLPDEGHFDNRGLLAATREAIRQARIPWHTGTEVTAVRPGRVVTARGEDAFDVVIDSRGLGAQADLKDLRGVRGELAYVQAPDVTLNRPVRLMHPRYPLYIVPRPDKMFVIGATKVESDDLNPVTLRGALELLSAAYSLHPGFAEGRVMDLTVNCRPAFRDNRPRIIRADGLIRVNGLYRHGFLCAPGLILGTVALLRDGRAEGISARFVEDAP